MQNFACSTSNQLSTAAQLIMFPAIDDKRLQYSVTACFSSLCKQTDTTSDDSISGFQFWYDINIL